VGRTGGSTDVSMVGSVVGSVDRSQDGTEHERRGIALAEQILAQVERDGLGPDGRMPTERQLAADLGVTRSAVRYALSLLAADGRLSREVGRGTYLRSAPPSAGSARNQAGEAAGPQQEPQLLGAFAPADVMMVRRLLEPPAMPLAVAWATAADLAELDRCLAGGDQAASYQEFEAWDLALHRALFAATHSPLLVTLYSSIEAARHGQVWGDLKRRSASPGRRRLYRADHHQIVAAIKARDTSAAIKAMRGHLAKVSDHLNATDPAAGSYQ
jgi:GntR family transcriptional regulator, uxu operon transcriptional repressor